MVGKNRDMIMLKRLQFVIFCLGMLQTITINETLAVTVGIDLKKNQTLNLLYNQPIPDTLYGDGEHKNVNFFEFSISFEVCSSDNTLASFKLYTVLTKFFGSSQVLLKSIPYMQDLAMLAICLIFTTLVFGGLLTMIVTLL